MDRSNLALEVVRVTEAAALATARLMGQPHFDGRPFDSAHGRPFDSAHGRPLHSGSMS
jgi:hypothetical protein